MAISTETACLTALKSTQGKLIPLSAETAALPFGPQAPIQHVLIQLKPPLLKNSVRFFHREKPADQFGLVQFQVPIADAGCDRGPLDSSGGLLLRWACRVSVGSRPELSNCDVVRSRHAASSLLRMAVSETPLPSRVDFL